MRPRIATVAAVIACAVFGFWFARFAGAMLLGATKSPLSSIMVAVVSGVLIGNLFPRVAADAATLTFCTVTVLRVGVVLLGLRLSLAAASDIGLHALPVVIVCISTALVLVTIASRAMGMNRQLGGLIAVGTSICGVTAIIATAPVIRAREAEVTYAVGCITLFGLLAMFVHPLIAHVQFAGFPRLAGVFLGTAVHDTSQVVGAAMIYQDRYAAAGALETATVTKLVRNLAMAVVIPLVAYLYRDPIQASGDSAAGKRPPIVPGFVLGFIAMCALRSLGDFSTPAFGIVPASAWGTAIGGAQTVSEWCFTLAMAAVGLQTRLDAFGHLGLKPVLLAMLAAAVVGAASLASIHVFLT
jgi:uncharacterized integral membrane protein (TIGR00698 family)